MPRPLFDSPYIFGIHEPGGEPHMLAAGHPEWILFAEVLGHDLRRPEWSRLHGSVSISVEIVNWRRAHQR